MSNRDRIEQFALFGYDPWFARPQHVNRPSFRNSEHFLGEMAKMIDRRWFTNDGPIVRQLEGEISDYVGVNHCIATSNGTMALQLLCKALALEGEVIMPSFTFIATAHAIAWQGGTPVFCDVLPDTMNLDPDHCERLIGPDTRAILGVHVWGRACDEGGRLAALAGKHGIPLLFDAAHGFGCGSNGKMVGSFGSAEAFSFHATKAFHTFEGGAITTNDGSLARQLRLLRNFGISGFDQVDQLGINGKMPEACAAAGLSNLRALDQTMQSAKEVFTVYADGLASVLQLTLVDTSNRGGCSNHHYVAFLVDPDAGGIDRDGLVSILHAENVIARRYFFPGCHRSAPYIDGDKPRVSLPVTDLLADKVLLLPAGAGMELIDAKKICNLIVAVFENQDAIVAYTKRK